MAIVELFSKRQKKLRGDLPDIYTYDVIPDTLKVQIVQIISDVTSEYSEFCDTEENFYKNVVQILCKEYGVFYLVEKSYRSVKYQNDLINYFMMEKDLEKCIDLIEISFIFLSKHMFECRMSSYHINHHDMLAFEAIEELNHRFKEHSIGYQFTDGQIIRIDSELIHSEVVKPALKLLHSKEFKGAQEEFLSAYEHYRNGKNKEALNDCLKAFESTMKSICDKRKWFYDKGKATAKDLIKVCFDNELIPKFWETNFSNLRSLLESSIPTGRNKLSGHGQGSIPKEIPDYLVSYMLHMTASTIVFLIESEKKLI